MKSLAVLAGLFLIPQLLLTGCAQDHRATPVDQKQQLSLTYPAPARLVAIGDVHGDLDAARRALILAGAINDRDEWIGGKLVVVQVGDQLDRGDDEQEILELFDRLREQADEAGGAFHILIGNHEVMNCKLDLRYVTPGGFADFEDAVTVDPDDPLLLSFPEEQRARVAAFRPGGPYAMRLANHNTIVIVGDTLFVHGGLHTEHISYGLDRINKEVRAWMQGKTEEPKLIPDGENPVWCRHFSLNVVPESRVMLEAVLSELEIKLAERKAK